MLIIIVLLLQVSVVSAYIIQFIHFMEVVVSFKKMLSEYRKNTFGIFRLYLVRIRLYQYDHYFGLTLNILPNRISFETPIAVTIQERDHALEQVVVAGAIDSEILFNRKWVKLCTATHALQLSGLRKACALLRIY